MRPITCVPMSPNDIDNPMSPNDIDNPMSPNDIDNTRVVLTVYGSKKITLQNFFVNFGFFCLKKSPCFL